MVERTLGKGEVESSILSSSTIPPPRAWRIFGGCRRGRIGPDDIRTAKPALAMIVRTVAGLVMRSAVLPAQYSISLRRSFKLQSNSPQCS